MHGIILYNSLKDAGVGVKLALAIQLRRTNIIVKGCLRNSGWIQMIVEVRDVGLCWFEHYRHYGYTATSTRLLFSSRTSNISTNLIHTCYKNKTQGFL